MADTQEKEHIQVDSYPCSNCGAYVKYSPGTTNLHCEYCGCDTPIDLKIAGKEVVELDLLVYLAKKEKLDAESTKVVYCHHCNAESTFDEKQKSMECPYCGTAIIESDIHYERLIKPSYLLPFNIAIAGVHDCMNKWIKKLWFAPGKLRKQAMHSNRLKAVFIPYWTYDADTTTSYRGRRGDNYTVTVGTGKNRRTEVRTRWYSVSGRVSRLFDDVLIPASKLIPTAVLTKLENWDKHNYVEFDRRFLSGMQTEKYSVSYVSGFEAAKTFMESVIRSDIRSDIGGDHQQITSSNTEYRNLGFKLILLPLYISSYTYKNKLYHFYVNGRTGEITGDRPYSAWKIFFAVLFGLAAAALLIYLFMQVE